MKTTVKFTAFHGEFKTEKEAKDFVGRLAELCNDFDPEALSS